ncbi:MAG: trypsin-like peptidase domain-containing protein [Rhodopila sp.]|nr:trypsin-like peptidase domain-containing protein [Rhodopila sp.]
MKGHDFVVRGSHGDRITNTRRSDPMFQSIFRLVAGTLASIGVILLVRTSPAMAQQMPTMQLDLTPTLTPTQASDSELIRKLLPSVVTINTRRDPTRSASGQNAANTSPEFTRAIASGFVIDPSGVIATCGHVVRGAWQFDVTFADGTIVPAHVLNASGLIDVALIKVDVGHKLPALHWGDSDELEIGDSVFTIGNALGVGIAVTGGIVSALNRDIMDSPYDDFIQTDAAINHGNSGGPLFNLKGEVVGIDSDIISSTTSWSGVGFAMPSRAARTVIGELMNPDEPRPGWIGVKLQPVTSEMREALGMERVEGSIVANVVSGGPAAEAGLRVGDIVLHLGTAPPTDHRALLRAILAAPTGQPITLALWRDGKEQSLEVTVKQWPIGRWDALDVPVTKPPPQRQIPPDLGIALAALDGANRARFGLALNQTGVLVTEVAANTDAADQGLAPGDVILRVQDKTVSTAAEARAAFAKARVENRQFVLILIAPKAHDEKAGPKWITLRVTNG